MPVAFEDELELPSRLVRVIRQQQPDVLYRRPGKHVVEVDEQKTFSGSVENIPPVQISVNPPQTDSVEKRNNPLDDTRSFAEKLVLHIGMDDFVSSQLFYVVDRRASRGTLEPARGGIHRPDRVESAGESAETEPILVAFGVELTAAPARI